MLMRPSPSYFLLKLGEEEMEWSSVILICGALLHSSAAIPLSGFYPFGTSAGDSELPSNDDGSAGPIRLTRVFPFFGRNHATLFVNNNGDISFDSAVSTYTPNPFPLSGDFQLIAPYWGDVDTRGGRGNVWYREASTNSTLLMRARREVMVYFISERNFDPTFLFIVTWDNVGYFGGSSSSLNNTFQCVLVSDGVRSFVFFLYADGLIQWTTGGSGRNGLGGTQAQVGFNAGDGVRFAVVPGSRTAEIINITMTSNVGRNGVWVFRVDTEEIMVMLCNESNPLAIAPSLGHMLGGTIILLGGPCFTPTNEIICTFDGSTRVVGSYNSEVTAICKSPYFETSGWKNLMVTIWSEGGLMLVFSGSSRFYARSLEEVADVRVVALDEENNLHAIQETNVRITWNPALLQPIIDPGSYLVDIHLSRYELAETFMGDSRTERIATLSANEANDGEAVVVVPSIIIGNTAQTEVYPVFIEMVISSRNSVGESNMVLPTITGIVNSATSWSNTFYYSLNRFFRERCQSWCNRQPENIGETILMNVLPCPRTVRQARAQNSGLEEDTGIARLLSRNFFHSGTNTCFRQTTFESESRSGQQCCYYSNGSLATGSPLGGAVDLVSPEKSRREHFVQDVIPYIYCCKLSQGNCDIYYQKRPSDNGSRYNPLPPACVYGDPHIVTLDGYKYTFNGRGEYILIQTLDDSFSLQGRMVPVMGSEGTPVQATVFSAIAAKEEFSATIQIQLTQNGQMLEMLMNGELVDFDLLSEQEFDNVTVADRGNNTLSATFSSGVYIEALASGGIISTLITSLSVRYRSQTQGLMGNFNGETADDLIPRRATTGIPLTSSLEDIHTMFGVTWIITDESESLFTYTGRQNFTFFHDPSFSPVFNPIFSDAALEQQADDICGNDQFCRFDIAATGRIDIGLSTAQGNLEFETIVNISIPAICTPPCANGVCVADDLCSCTTGYEGDRCNEAIIFPCDINPCENGGVCQLRAGSYICICPSGFIGIRCQEMQEIVTDAPGSGDIFGSGTCDCRRPVECSISGRRIGTDTVIPDGRSLHCVISSSDQATLMEEEMPTLLGEAMPGSGVAFGSGMGTMTVADPIFIDQSFREGTFLDTLSPGSFSFLREIGVFSRNEGVSTCSLQGAQESNEILGQFLGVDQLVVVYQNANNIYNDVELNFNSFFQILQSREFSLQGRLDAVQQCSLAFLFDALNQPPSQHQFICRASSPETLITFTVYCVDGLSP